MYRNKIILRVALLLVPMIAVIAVGSHQIKAAFYNPVLTTYVEIDGVNYGAFDQIDGLQLFAEDGYPDTDGDTYQTVRLSREFVTDPSLYLWAKNRMQRKMGLQDIHLITEDEDGNVVSQLVLQLCQPLSWSVESTNPSLGGFNETIDFAVQKITSF
ncbi:hypothetical protein [Pseudobacteriovorax antillogorgiicola]|uniref:Uncharacterized protein n=1 Tax=Pseudobacteriovorax antillogorgiicola TaxID=1513793 RepID=A0A1Y6CU05_9BACT|nr:hypothetical protein [Pseudobacteriovorax antillogorgiicola]TCS44403.1 hypothetical protein EDD56_13330 [Pseudobacteriovorax antillogorgiicola]SMF79241.1 hypothetical protein SAMN06296036_13344 [Pseudobacteriovorax antillogorgiicola]